MQSNVGFVPTSKAVLRPNGGPLKSLYDSDKWEFGRKNWNMRNWKQYRRFQWKAKQ